MYKKIISIILSLGISTSSFAVCDKEVTFLKEGELTKCNGYLFTEAKEYSLRLDMLKLDLLQQELDIKDKLIDKYKLDLQYYQQLIEKEQQRAEVWRKSAENSTNLLMQKETRQEYRDWLFLLLGIGITIGAGYCVGQIHK